MRTPLLALTTVLALAACTPGGEFVDPPAMSAEQATALRAGIEKLGDLPALSYEGVQNSVTNEFEDADVSWRVTAGGTAYGTAAAGGRQATLMSADGLVFVLAGEEYWLSGQYPQVGAKGIDGWARVYDQGWIDPARFLTPAVYATALGEAMEDDHVFDRPLPLAVDVGGVKAHPIPVGDGTVYTGEDGAILRVEGVAVTGIDDTGVDFTGNVAPLDRVTVDRTRGDVLAGVAEVGEVRWFDNIFSDLDDDGVDIECNSRGMCTLSVKATLHVAEEEKGVDFAFMVGFEATASVDDDNERTCTQQKKVDAGKSVTLSCKARVELSDGADTLIYGEGYAQMVYALYRGDVAGLTAKITGEFDRIAAATP